MTARLPLLTDAAVAAAVAAMPPRSPVAFRRPAAPPSLRSPRLGTLQVDVLAALIATLPRPGFRVIEGGRRDGR